MTDETLYPIDKKKLVEIRGKFYVPQSEKDDLVGSQSFIPFYFAVLDIGKILHDTPALGCMSIGDSNRYVQGPFLSIKEAQEVIEKKKKELDHVSYEFSSCISSVVLPQQSVPESRQIPVFRYYELVYRLYADRQLYSYRMKPSPEQFDEFTKIIIERTKSMTREFNEDKSGIIAIVDDSFIEIRTHPCLELLIKTFSSNPSSRVFSTRYSLTQDKIKELNMDNPYALEERSHSYEFVSLSPIKFSLKSTSVEDILKNNDLF